MSNCIDIELSLVTLTSKEFRVRDYKELIESHKPHLEQDFDVDDAVCWFLTDNSFFKDDSVTIAFGRGRSGHTWRDFRWTIWFLNQYFLAHVSHTFLISDEYDGFETQFPVTVNWPYESIDQLANSIP